MVFDGFPNICENSHTKKVLDVFWFYFKFFVVVLPAGLEGCGKLGRYKGFIRTYLGPQQLPGGLDYEGLYYGGLDYGEQLGFQMGGELDMSEGKKAQVLL